MNKITTTLTGLAVVAAATVAPAFAQGAFFASAPFTFAFAPANSFTISNIAVNYNPFGVGAPSTGFLTLTGGNELGSSVIYNNTLLSFTNGTTSFTDTVAQTTIVPLGNGSYSIASVGATGNGNQFNLVPGAPVPEASTVISFGALLALGGLAVLRRKSAVKNAA